jgi:hypothetical protein
MHDLQQPAGSQETVQDGGVGLNPTPDEQVAGVISLLALTLGRSWCGPLAVSK